MKTKNTQRTSSWTIVLFISLIILVVMGLVSNALEIGERLGNVHIVLEILFYVLIAVVVLGGITKNYLLNADVSMTRKELRKKSYAEAMNILKKIIKQGMDEKVKEPVKNFFSRKKKIEVVNIEPPQMLPDHENS